MPQQVLDHNGDVIMNYKMTSDDVTNLTNFFSGKLEIGNKKFISSRPSIFTKLLPNALTNNIHLNKNGSISFPTTKGKITFRSLPEFFEVLRNQQQSSKIT